MTRYRARWVVPIDSHPLEGAEVEVERDRIVSVGRAAFPAARTSGRDRAVDRTGMPEREVVDLGDAVLFPAPVNAHTHLEWSHLQGRAPAGPPFTGWVRRLLALPRPDAAAITRAAAKAANACAAQGVRVLGDFSASLAGLAAMKDAGLEGAVFHELIGLPAARAEAIERDSRQRIVACGYDAEDSAVPDRRRSLSVHPAPHGPHTVSRELLRSLGLRVARGECRLAIHLAESEEEMEFLLTGQGPFRDIHENRKSWDGSWTPPGLTPVRYLDSLGLLTPRTLAVHCVHVDEEEIGLLRERGATVVVCPRSNRWTGAGKAPLPRLLGAGVLCALGTDSLASNRDLDMAAELAAARQVWPEVPPATLVEMATRGGARALGLATKTGVGSLAAGARAAIAWAAIPAGTPAGSDPCAILCGDHGPAPFRQLPDRAAPSFP